MSTIQYGFFLADGATKTLLVAVAFALSAFYILRLQATKKATNVPELPCPQDAEFLWGHERSVFMRSSGVQYSEWFEQLGPVYRIKGALFHSDILLLSDRAAIRHVLTNMHYYTRAPYTRKGIELVSGKGIVWSEGEMHKRFRRLMEPAFSTAAVKSMAETVLDSSQTLANDLTAHLEAHNDEMVLNMAHWTASTTLNTIGRIGFGYDFYNDESHDGKEVVQGWERVVDNMMSPVAFYAEVFIRAFPYLLSLPLAAIRSQSQCKEAVTKLALSVIRARQSDDEDKSSEQKKTILDILLSATGEGKMTIEEIVDNICTVFLAGYETTAMAINMILYELAQNPASQIKLREELSTLGRNPTYEDLVESTTLTYLDAVVKEGLRMYPAMANNTRVAIQADVIPLAEPIRTPSGKILKEIRVDAGQTIYIPTDSVNSLSSVWGDGNVFRPERWIEPKGLSAKVKTQNGWSNLLSFSTGPKLCIGYKLALLEMKSITASLIRTFEFNVTAKVEVKNAMVLTSRVVGEENKGVQMPLRVNLVAHDR